MSILLLIAILLIFQGIVAVYISNKSSTGKDKQGMKTREGNPQTKITIRVKDPETCSTIDMEVDRGNTAEEIIETAVEHWEKGEWRYTLRKRDEKRPAREYAGDITVAEMDITEGDILVIIPNPC